MEDPLIVGSIFSFKDFQEEYDTIFFGTSFRLIIISKNLEVPSIMGHDGGCNEKVHILPKKHLQSGHLVLFITSDICNSLSVQQHPICNSAFKT